MLWRLNKLQYSIEEYEIRINERISTQELVLQALSNYKGKGKGSWKGNKSSFNHKHQDHISSETSDSFKGNKNYQPQKKDNNSNSSKEWKFDKRKVRCHKCQKLGHYAKYYWLGEVAKNKPINSANLAQDEESDSKVVMLMTTTSIKSS